MFAGLDLLGLLAAYGYLAVFLFIGMKTMGIPFPGETMLIPAAIYTGNTHRLNIILVIAAAAAGAVAFFVFLRRNEERLMEEAEAAIPTPV